MQNLLLAVLGLLGVAILSPIGSVWGNLLVLAAVLGIFYGTLVLGTLKTPDHEDVSPLPSALVDATPTQPEEK